MTFKCVDEIMSNVGDACYLHLCDSINDMLLQFCPSKNVHHIFNDEGKGN